MKTKYLIHIILVIFITIIVVFIIVNRNSLDNSIFPDKNIQVNVNKKYKKISIEKLITKYKNEVYGDKFYKNKIYTVYGKVREIKVGDDYLTIVLYSEAYTFEQIICYMDNCYKNDVEKYHVGDIIELTGVIQGKFYDIIVDNCIYNGGQNG